MDSIEQVPAEDYYDLGESGLAWVKECLRDGHMLAYYIGSTVNIGEGRTLAIGPTDLESIANAPTPDTPMLVSPINEPRSVEVLLALLHRLAQLTADVLIVAEDILVSAKTHTEILDAPDDPRYQAMRQVAYHCMPLRGLHSPSELRIFISRYTMGYPENVFVLQQMDCGTLKSLLQRRDFASVAGHLVGIINAVWDCTGHSFWTRANIASEIFG